MPLAPNYAWEETETDLHLSIGIKGVKKDKIDVFIADCFVKVNSPPTYLLQLDLLHDVVVEKATYLVDPPMVRITLPKLTPKLVWGACTLEEDSLTKDALAQRRAAAVSRAEALYGSRLELRQQQKEVEKKRMFHEHWALEKQQRREIEEKMRAEKEEEQGKLYEWEDKMKAEKKVITPGDIGLGMPPVRDSETTVVPIDFSAKTSSEPVRSRGDEDYYQKSRYKPTSIEDSPMFWKEKADKLYHQRQWKASADAYSESIKRDGSFLTCVANRAACYIRLHKYKRAIEDCDLALTILGNTPASDTTQDRYRKNLMKLHCRRGAAYCWDGQLSRGIDDYKTAVAYRSSAEDDDILKDLDTITELMRKTNVTQEVDPLDVMRSDANRLYLGQKYSDAIDMYYAILAKNEFDYKTRSNLCAALLQAARFEDCLTEAFKIAEFCAEVAKALTEPGVQSVTIVDSDDEEGGEEDEATLRKKKASETIREKSGHVYMLLKCYVRIGAAYCGLKDQRKGLEYLEQAMRITPYDDDLRDDINRLIEKLRLTAVVELTTKQ